MSNWPSPLTLPGIVWRDPDGTAKILTRYRSAGKETMHFVWDWDGTVAPLNGSTWHIMRDILPPEGQARHIQLYERYKPLEDAGRLTSTSEREWSEQALKLHVEYGTKISDLERGAVKINVRHRAPDIFAVCKQADVPTVILSAGVSNVIAITAKRYDMHPAAILGVELTIRGGVISGWVKDSIVDAHTKREMGHPHITKVRANHPNAILFGDQPQDAGMASGPALRLRINCGGAPGTQGWELYLEESWQAGFDGIITDEDLGASLRLTQWLVNS